MYINERDSPSGISFHFKLPSFYEFAMTKREIATKIRNMSMICCRYLRIIES